MGVSFHSPVVISTQWSSFKTIAINKFLAVQYDNDSDKYTIFALDNNIVYVCYIFHGTVPPGFDGGTYSQGQNDSDKADFEANYYPNANKTITTVGINPIQQTVLSNQDVNVSGTSPNYNFPTREINLVINVKTAPTGTTPTLQFTLQELDPGDQVTVIQSVSSILFSTIGTQVIKLKATNSSIFNVTWTISGASADFPSVYAVLTSKVTSTVALADSSGSEARVSPFERRLHTKVLAPAFQDNFSNANSFSSTIWSSGTQGAGASNSGVGNTGQGGLSVTTTVSSYAYAYSLFTQNVGSSPSSIFIANAFTDVPAANTGARTWGYGTSVAVNQLSDGFFFYLPITGPLQAVQYVNQSQVQTANISTPSGGFGITHTYIIEVTQTTAYFFIDTLDTPVATFDYTSTAHTPFKKQWGAAALVTSGTAGTTKIVFNSVTISSDASITATSGSPLPSLGSLGMPIVGQDNNSLAQFLQVDASKNLKVTLASAPPTPEFAASERLNGAYGDTMAGYATIASVSTTKISNGTFSGGIVNAVVSISSSSASDTNSAGTGARKVRFIYQDSTGVYFDSGDVSLNGTSAVTFTASTNVFFIVKMWVTAAGSGLTNAGTITATVGGVTYVQMSAGDGLTFHGGYINTALASGHNLYIRRFHCSSQTTAGWAGLGYASISSGSAVPGSFTGWLHDQIRVPVGQTTIIEFNPPLRIMPGVCVMPFFQADSTTSTKVKAGYDIMDE